MSVKTAPTSSDSAHGAGTAKESKTPVGKALIVAAAFVLAAAVASVAGFFSPKVDPNSAVAMQWPGPLGLCLEPVQGSVCFDQPNEDDVMHLLASGLEPGSIVTIKSSAGNVNLTVAGNGFLEADIGGELVKRDFTTTGTWADGESLVLEVLMS